MATGSNKQLSTHSRRAAFKTCRRKHWFSYELGIRRDTDAKALRMGSAYHKGLEISKQSGLDAAVTEIRRRYSETPDSVDAREWAIEGVTVEALLCGYFWRWENEPLIILATEKAFELPIINPATGAATPNWDAAGKIDGLVRLQDAREAVLEHKLLSDDLSSDSNLWRRLQIDEQITNYVIAARGLGHPVDCVLYDVTRKPTIRPGDVPVLDTDGLRIVLDADGNRVENEARWRQTAGAGFTVLCQPVPEPEPDADGEPEKAKKKTAGKPVAILDNDGLKIILDAAGNRVENKCGRWKQSGDKVKNQILLMREMTLDEWAERLLADISERPDFYYVRREIARLETDLDEFREELWQTQITMREAQRTGRHFRTAGLHCDFCTYFGLCTANYQPGQSLPEDYRVVSDIHPELKGDEDHERRDTDTTTTYPTAGDQTPEVDSTAAAAADSIVAG